MPSPAVVTFGPGRLESIELRKVRRHREVMARVVGTFRIFCGMGNDHTQRVNGPYVFMSPYRAILSEDELASELIEYELEDWFDPCDQG